MVTSGTALISPTFNNIASAWIGHGASSGNSHMGVFRPTQPATFETVTRLNILDISLTTSVVYGNSREIAIPYLICSRQSPFYYAGHLRQIYAVADCTNFRTTTAGFAASGNNSGTADGWLYGVV
jgi:hypothetical protein